MNQKELLEELETLRCKVAELDAAKSDLRESQSKYRAMVEAFDGLIYICSEDYKIEFANSHFVERIGRNPVGEDCFRAIHGLEEVCPWCVNEKVMAGETVRWEVRSPKDKHWYYAVNSPIHRSDGSVSKIAMIQDITDRKEAELAREESERRYRELVESAGAIIFRTDAGGNFTFVNSFVVETTGFSADELIGRNYLELIAPDRRPELERFYGIQFVKKLSDTYQEFPTITKDGETVWIGQHVRLIMENDEPVGFQAIARDISDRKKAEEAHKESEERFRALSEATFEAVFLSDKGTCVGQNLSAEEMFGYSTEEAVGRSGTEWIAPESRDLVLQHMQSGYEEPYEAIALRRNGTTFPCEIQGKMIDYRGRRIRVTALRDTTGQKRTEKALRESEVLLRHILDVSPVGIAVGVKRKITWVNNTWIEMFGLTDESDHVGQDTRVLYPSEEEYSRVGEVLYRDLETGRVNEGDVVFSAKNGRVFDAYMRLKRFDPNDPNKGVIVACLDISARKKTEEELEKARALLSAAIEQSPTGILIADAPDVNIRVANSAALEIRGDSKEPLTDIPVDRHTASWQVYHPNGTAFKPEELPLSRAVLNGETSKNVEALIRHPDGEPRWVLANAAPVRDRAGEVVAGVVVFADITKRKRSEKTLTENVSMLQSILEKAADGICVCHDTAEDPFIRFTHWNPGMTEITGFTMDEINESGWYQSLYSDAALRRQAPDLIARMRQREDIRAEEWDITSKDGRKRSLSVSASLLKEEEGQIYVLASMQDISVRKLTEQSLRESEAFNRRLVQYSPLGIIYLTAEGDISFTNPACNRIFGVPEDEPSPLLGLSIFDLPLIAEQPQLKVRFEELVRDGKAQRDVELAYRSPLSGRDFTLLASATPRPAADGSIVGSVVMLSDITDRKHAEDQLQRLFTAVDQAAEAMVVTDHSGKIEYVNPAFETITGYRREEAIGQNPRILKSGVHDDAFYKSMWETLTAGEVWRGDLVNRRKDGFHYEEKATISPIKDERGRIVNYVAVKRDVTGEIKLQKQLLQAQKMEAIGTLAGGMAHDFNNLLMVILGYADLLSQQRQPDDLERRKLAAIVKAAKDGADLVNRILTFSKGIESRVRPVDLNVEIGRIEELMVRTLPKMISIEILLAKDLSTINADPAQIEQIVLNLALNAHHAMPEGGRLVIETSNVNLSEDFCRLHVEAKPEKYVVLIVSDTGHGIEPEIVDRIFEPFFSTKQDGEGTGLGLSMVHGIVAQHGGFIRCYSEPGAGTTFKLYFPAAATRAVEDAAVSVEMPAFGSETILLVDDVESIRVLAEEMLTMAGYKVLTAINGDEALEIYKIRKEEISLVILDLIMPGMSGNRCLQELLQIDPSVKVLISSGYSANGPTKSVVAAGAKGFISKPYDTKDLLKAIRKTLDEAESI